VRYDTPRFLPVGDSALLIEYGDEISLDINSQVHALALVLANLSAAGVGEAVPAYRSLLLHYDPYQLYYDEVLDLAQEVLDRVEGRVQPEPRVVDIPTAYGGDYGPDLAYVAQHNDLKPAEVVRLHSSILYPVYMLGFSPGFPYLGGVPDAITTPRLSSPRSSVPAGSVGIAGAQTGIYPLATPGGWQLIGRTPLRLFTPQNDPPTLLRPGDRVRFVPIDPDQFDALREQEWKARKSSTVIPTSPEGAGLQVIRPGILTTVQDWGRRGYQRFGIPVAGAMDHFALRAANTLVGNPPEAAGLEINTAGLVLEATANCLIAVGGADLGLRVNGIPIPNWETAFVRRGWQIEFSGRRGGCRAYLAAAGGIDLPAVMGSQSTYLRGGLGGVHGRTLQAGDFLPVAPVEWPLPERAARCLPSELIPAYGDHPTVQVVLGPQQEAFSQEALAVFLDSEFQVTPAADRMGYRLRGAAVAHCGSADIVSDGIVLGAVQVPADQQPIVMMADRQTTGGYPKIATVISTDIPLLAQCRPGQSTIRFKETSVQQAQQSYRRMIAGLNSLFED